MKIFFILFPFGAWASQSGIDIATSTLPIAIVHRPYSPPPLTLTGGGRCAVNQIFTRVVSGEVPEGISLSSAGYFSGTPLREGTYSFAVKATNECVSFTKYFTLRVDGPAILNVGPANLSFVFREGDSPRAGTVRIGSNWQDLAYAIEADSDAAWLELRPLAGRTPGAGSALQDDTVEVLVNPAKLAPGVHRINLRVSAWQSANAPIVPIVVTIRKKAEMF